MGNCTFCELEIGDTVRLHGENVLPCCQISVDNTGRLAQYQKYDGAFHYFRIHDSRKCPSCGRRWDTICMPCFDYSDGLFINSGIEQETYE